jgi:hypothetical protein
MFKKKFKVRVRHYYEASYCIEYTTYRFFPIIWLTIDYWTELGSIGEYIPILFRYATAEEYAKKFKSYDDIIYHYILERKKEKEFYEKQKKYNNVNIPYKTKIIN